MKRLTFSLGFLCLIVGCAHYQWIAPSTTEKIPFPHDKFLVVNSLPNEIVDATTTFFGSNVEGHYEIDGEVVVLNSSDPYLFSASILKLSPKLMIPIYSNATRLGTFGGTYIGTTAKGKMKLKNPIAVGFRFNTTEYVLSGPQGCTLKRTSGKDLTLIEGEAFLLK